MFRAHRAHHQERQIVSIQPLVAVGGRVVCTLGVNFTPNLHTTRPPTQSDSYQRLYLTTLCMYKQERLWLMCVNFINHVGVTRESNCNYAVWLGFLRFPCSLLIQIYLYWLAIITHKFYTKHFTVFVSQQLRNISTCWNFEVTTCTINREKLRRHVNNGLLKEIKTW